MFSLISMLSGFFTVRVRLYIRDPKNNGTVIYCDRPSTEWPRDSEGHVMMDMLLLDLDALVLEEERMQKYFLMGQKSHIFLSESQTLKGQSRFDHGKPGLIRSYNL